VVAVDAGGPTLVVDIRERSLLVALATMTSDVADVLDATTVTSRVLDVGDVEIRIGDACALVVERKTVPDLIASMRDGRWSEQKRRMMDTAGKERVAYVIEGAGSLAWDCDKERCINGMPASRVQGALTSLLLGHRVPVVFTRDVADTAAFLRRAATFLSTPPKGSSGGYAGAACRASAVRAKKRDNVDARQCYLQQLCQVPGVSYCLATAIADLDGGVAFGSMRALIGTLEALPTHKARLAALQRVPKVGKTLAERITFSLGMPAALPPTGESGGISQAKA
jgi:ERCC4-type nuclease